MEIILIRVQYIPQELEVGKLYVSEEYGAAAHLCACGCGHKVNTPIGPTDWSLKVIRGKPSLFPSVGNWQIPCKSHYWIRNGEIEWAPAWSDEQISAGRRAEQRRDEEYFSRKLNKPKSRILRFIEWISSILRRS
jgi:hypothetical protein